MTRPVRLLHLVENLHIGAVENWLVRTFRHSRRRFPGFDWTFYCVLGEPGRLDDEVRALGGTVIHPPHPLGHKLAFARHLRATLVAGRYDVLHSHHDLLSAFYIAVAAGLPLWRIVHVHNTDEGIPVGGLFKQTLLREPMRRACLALADEVVGISTHTLDFFLKGLRPRSGRARVVYYGVDLSAFRDPPPDPAVLRAELRLPPDAVVLLFLGRMVTLKNPVFAVEVLAAAVLALPNAVAVLAGAGDLADAVRARATELGVADRVRVLGWRDDTARLMRGSDVFLFPRLEEPKEGLGLVLVEAQAAGLPVLMSPSVSPDVVVVPNLFETVPLAAGPIAWAERLVSLLGRPRPDRGGCVDAVETSRFGLDAGVESFMSLYEPLAGSLPPR